LLGEPAAEEADTVAGDDTAGIDEGFQSAQHSRTCASMAAA
jgi:hypothetical protein